MTTQCEKAFEEYYNVGPIDMTQKNNTGNFHFAQTRSAWSVWQVAWQAAWEARGTADESKLEILKEQRMKEHQEDHGEYLSTCSRCAEICGYINSIEAIKMVG